jgi:hypothetical protein
MRDSDLAEYLDHDLFLERLEPPPRVPRKSDVTSAPQPLVPASPEPPTRSAETEREKFKSDILHMVMSVFTGARWTTRDAYKRASAQRDRKGRKKRE